MADNRPKPDAVISQSEIDSPAGDMATIEAMLEGDGPMLLGISGAPEDRTAIVLDRDGEILRLKQGDRLSHSTVLEISDNQVQLQDDGLHVIALTLPA